MSEPAVVDANHRPEALVRWLAWLGTEDCTCAYSWRSLGILYGVSMGKCWVRMTTEPECPHHGTAAVAAWKAGQT